MSDNIFFFLKFWYIYYLEMLLMMIKVLIFGIEG